MKSEKATLLCGIWMIVCFMLGVYSLSLPKEFHLVADAFLVLALFCLIGMIRGLVRNL